MSMPRLRYPVSAARLLWVSAPAFCLISCPACCRYSFKLSVFLRPEAEAERRARRLREHLVFFALGILVWFQLLAFAFGATDRIWGQLFQNSSFVYALLALVFVLGLSLLGVFTLPLIDLKTDSASPRVQAFFTGFTATLLATPCSGPLLGGVLAWAFIQDAPAPFIVCSAVGAGMALPYLVFALRPEAARFLPRPGPWLEVMERILGFCFMGLAVYLLSLLPEERRIAALAALALFAPAAWVWGRLSCASARPVLFKAVATALCVLALWVGLREPAPPAHWEPFVPQNFEAALGKKPLLLMFTADWCPNCEVLEHAVYTEARLRDMQSRYGLGLIRVDMTRENAQATSLLRSLGSAAIPFAALFPTGPDASAPLVLRDMYSGAQLEEALRQSFDPAP